jgi:hypothetical protein
MDNLRAAFAWSRERADDKVALGLASSLQPVWSMRGRVQEGLNWLSAALPAKAHKAATHRLRACGLPQTPPGDLFQGVCRRRIGRGRFILR